MEIPKELPTEVAMLARATADAICEVTDFVAEACQSDEPGPNVLSDITCAINGVAHILLGPTTKERRILGLDKDPEIEY